MAFADAPALAGDSIFRGRVKACLYKVAATVLSEPNDGSVRRQKRQRLAIEFIVAADTWMDRVAWALASATALTAASTDNAMETAVTGMFNRLAQVESTDG